MPIVMNYLGIARCIDPPSAMERRCRVARKDPPATRPQPRGLSAHQWRELCAARQIDVWMDRDVAGAQGVRRQPAGSDRLAAHEWFPHAGQCALNP
ncbi:hypothetical protein MABM_16200 [Mycobacteroides abscessus]|nr:hypothetical protein MABM_16200 [Mycobacteroides abscessus]